MRKLNLTFPDEIIEEVSLLCLNRPKICKKESKLGWTSNDRILHAQNNYIEYYNLHPGFVEDDPASLKKRYFKAAVRLDFIHEVNFLPKNKIKKTYIEIVFPEKKKVTNSSDQAKAVENEEDEEAKAQEEQILEKWLFEFSFDIKEFIEAKREQAVEKQRVLAKITPISPKQMKDATRSEPVILTPKSIEMEDSLEQNIEQYVDSIQKTKSLMKSKAELAEEERVRQKKKKEKEMAEIIHSKSQNVQQIFSISSFWREYYKFYEIIIKADSKIPPLEKIEKEIGLLREIEYFNSIAKKIVKNYVDEFVCGFEESNKEFEGFRYYQGLWLKTGGKELNQEFIVNYNINDILFTLKDVKGYKFRLPLMSLIEYKGVKLLIMCDMPFSELEKTEVYNLLSQEGDLQLMGKLKESLDVIEDVLNVKSQPLELDAKKKVLAPLGASLKIYEYNFKKDKTQDQVILPNFYYLINPGIVFPIDYNFQRDGLNEMARLRPEIVAFFRDYYKDENAQLLTQAFMYSTMAEEAKKLEDLKAIEASKLIEAYWLPVLIDKLNDLDLLLVDSYSIKCTMQEMGINVRYLYRIYEKIALPYVRELVLIEALARTIKKEFRQALSDLSNESASSSRGGQASNNKESLNDLNQKKTEGINNYNSFALDYLNLVFGEGVQTQQFWKIVLIKCTRYFKISTVYPPPVKAGCLLNAVLWHCGLSISFDETVPLFKSANPFKEGDNIEFEMHLKTFDFPSFEIQKLFRSAPSTEAKVSDDLFKQVNPKLLKMELLFGRTIGTNWQFNATLAKLNNFEQYLQKPSLKNKLHPMLIPYYITNKSTYNFTCGLKILNFALPETHPLFVSFYLEYKTVFEADLMKKSALLLAVKCFGEFHPKTTELYSEFYREGDTEYSLKAQRMKSIEACSLICQEFYEDQKYQSCLNYCRDQISKINQKKGLEKLGTGNYAIYLTMLMQGLESALKIIELDKGIEISKQISEVVSSFKFKDKVFTEKLFRHTLIIHLLKSNKKYFLYKMVLFVLHIRKNHEDVRCDRSDLALACSGEEKDGILQGLASEYYEHGNHSNWIAYIIATIVKSFQYFNFLENLFNNYESHLNRYSSEDFRNCLGYLDLLVRLYGQQLFKQTLYDVSFN